MTTPTTQDRVRAFIERHHDALHGYELFEPDSRTVQLVLDHGIAVRAPSDDPATWEAIADHLCARLYGYRHLEPTDPTRIVCSHLLTQFEHELATTRTHAANPRIQLPHPADIDPDHVDWSTVRYHLMRSQVIDEHHALSFNARAYAARITYTTRAYLDRTRTPDNADQVRADADNLYTSLVKMREAIDNAIAGLDRSFYLPHGMNPTRKDDDS